MRNVPHWLGILRLDTDKRLQGRVRMILLINSTKRFKIGGFLDVSLPGIAGMGALVFNLYYR